MFRHLVDLAFPLAWGIAIVVQIWRGSVVVGSFRHSPWAGITIDRDNDAGAFWIAIAIQGAAALFFGLLLAYGSFHRR